MIDCSAQLATFFETGRAARRFDLYTIVTTVGTVLRYTTADVPVLLPDGRVFGRGPLITRSKWRSVRGVEVDDMTLAITPRSSDLVGSLPLLQFARSGGLRGCTVQLEWAFFDIARTLQGTLPRFFGRGSPTALEAGAIELRVRSATEALQQQMPRDVYGPRCLNQVFDPRCGAQESGYASTAAVASLVSNGGRSQFGASISGRPDTYFDRGVVRFTSGANAGLQRTVRSWSGGVFSFALPWPQPVAIGDTFRASPGCDGTMATCGGRYANLARFRGQPFIPAPESAT